MVSGFLTSPKDHSLIFSGDAKEILTALKLDGSLGFVKKLYISSNACLPYNSRLEIDNWRLSIPPNRPLFNIPSTKPNDFAKSHGTDGLFTKPSNLAILKELNLQTKALQFFHEHLKGLRQPGLKDIITLDDPFIHPGPPGHIIRFDS